MAYKFSQIPVPIPEFIMSTEDVLSSQFYLDRLKDLNKDLEIGEPFRKVRACLGIVELAFSIGVPLNELPELVEHLLTLFEQDIVLARPAAWALFWLHGGTGENQLQNGLLAWQPSDKQLQVMKSAVTRDELDPTVAIFVISIIHGGYKKRALLNDVEQKHIASKLACQLYREPVLTVNANQALGMIDNKWAIAALVEQLKVDDINLREQSLSTLKTLDLLNIARQQFPEALAEFKEEFPTR